MDHPHKQSGADAGGGLGQGVGIELDDPYLARILAIVPSGVVIVDRSGEIVFANAAAERMLMPTAEPMVGRSFRDPVWEVFHSDGTPMAPEDRPYTYVMRTGRPLENFELIVRRGDGTELAGLLTAAPVRGPDGSIAGVISAFSDISERRRTEAALRESEEQVRLALKQAETAREEESSRIARELHDELGQTLTSLKLDLSWIERRLRNATDREQIAAARDRVSSLAREVDSTVQVVRRISTELRPQVLDDLGLTAAVEWKVQDFERRTGIACTTDARGLDRDVDSRCSAAVYRILSEALTNVARHAEASRVEVVLTQTERWVQLEVRDDGRGIEEEVGATPNASGLLGMRERARSLGGVFRLGGAPGEGAVISVRIPLSEARA